jgi:hypothetical protein
MISIAITSKGNMGLNAIYFWLRRNMEWLTTLGVGGVIVRNREWIGSQFANEVWKIDAFYSAVFDWSSIQAAFLFSVYAFFLSRSEPFIKAIATTSSFRALRSYVLRTLALAMGLTVLSLPLVVAPMGIKSGSPCDIGFVIFCLTMLALSYTFMCFVKVIRVFGKLEAMEE